MKRIYSDTKPPNKFQVDSIFLAGPTPRDNKTCSWRPQALEILEAKNFQGEVCLPEWSTGEAQLDYSNQVEWEYHCLSRVSAIVFWVPRNMKDMPALTTNVEFGYWLAQTPERVVYGRPNDAENVRYLDWLYKKADGLKIHDNMDSMFDQTLEILADTEAYLKAKKNAFC